MFVYGAHFQRLLSLPSGTDSRTGTAAGAVLFRDNHGNLIPGFPCNRQHGHPRWRRCRFLLIHHRRPDHRMGADKGTAITLNTVFRFPDGNLRGNIAPFMRRRTGRNGTVGNIHKSRYRQPVPFLYNHRLLYPADKPFHFFPVRKQILIQRFVLCRFPAFLYFHLFYFFHSPVNRRIVHIDNFITLTLIGQFCGIFHQFQRFVRRNNAGQLEKGCL